MRIRSPHHVPHALGERRGLRRAARLAFTPHTPHARRRASPSRFAPRTCTPAPSHAPNCDAHSMRPYSLTDFFRHFPTPKIWVGGWPLARLCRSAVCSGWAGQEGGGQQEGGRSGGAGPPPHWMCCVCNAQPRSDACTDCFGVVVAREAPSRTLTTAAWCTKGPSRQLRCHAIVQHAAVPNAATRGGLHDSVRTFACRTHAVTFRCTHIPHRAPAVRPDPSRGV